MEPKQEVKMAPWLTVKTNFPFKGVFIIYQRGGSGQKVGGARKNATRFEGGRKNFRRDLGGGEKKIFFSFFN